MFVNVKVCLVELITFGMRWGVEMGAEKHCPLTQGEKQNFSEVELLSFDLPQDHEPYAQEPNPLVNQTRRKHTRHPARWAAVATLADKTNFPCRLENISISGALLNSSVRVNPGQRAHLKMDSYVFGVKRVLDAVVEFKHVSLCDNTYRIGCEFVKVRPSTARFIALYVQKKNPHIQEESSEQSALCPA